MTVMRDEKVEAIVTAEYYNDGKQVKGVFETVDDAYVLVNINVFERLLNSSSDMTLEDAFQAFGKEIYEMYQKKLDVEREQASKARRLEVIKQINEGRQETYKKKELQVLLGVLSYKSLEELMQEYMVSRTYIYNLLGSLTEKKLYDFYHRNPHQFKGISIKQLEDLIKCNFKLSGMQAIRKQVEQENHKIKEEAQRSIAEVYSRVDLSENGVCNAPKKETIYADIDSIEETVIEVAKIIERKPEYVELPMPVETREAREARLEASTIEIVMEKRRLAGPKVRPRVLA